MLVTLSPSLLRKVSLDIQRENLLHIKWLASYKVRFRGNRGNEYVPKFEVTELCWFLPSIIDAHFQDRRFLMFPLAWIPSKSTRNHPDGVCAGVMVCLWLLFFYINSFITNTCIVIIRIWSSRWYYTSCPPLVPFMSSWTYILWASCSTAATSVILNHHYLRHLLIGLERKLIQIT